MDPQTFALALVFDTPPKDTHTQDLERLFTEAGFDLGKTLRANLFSSQGPTGTTLDHFIVPERARARGLIIDDSFLPLNWNYHRYDLLPEYRGEVYQLRDQLLEHRPRIIVALGVFAMWALTGVSHLGKYHGKLLLNELTGYGYVIPTFSLASLRYDRNREWYLKSVLDLAQKSARIKQPICLFR